MTSGERIRTIRKQRGWTLQELAEQLGLSMTTVSTTELMNSHPRQRTLERYAAALKVPVALLRPDGPPLPVHHAHVGRRIPGRWEEQS